MVQLLRQLLRVILPRRVHSRLRRKVGGLLLDVTMQRIVREPAALTTSPVLVKRAIWGWSSGWCVSYEFIEEALSLLSSTNGPILECGSGLSTLLIGAYAKPQGRALYSLEHDPTYATRVLTLVKRYSLDNVSILVSPIITYSEFDWYEVPVTLADKTFQFVICDGPPGNTRGGRVGLLPPLRCQLASGCVILLDDAKRSVEQRNLREPLNKR